MCDRICALGTLIILSLSVLLGDSAFAQQGLEANGVVELTHEPLLLELSESSAPTSNEPNPIEVEPSAAELGEASEPAEEPTSSVPFVAPSIEKKPLGPSVKAKEASTFASGESEQTRSSFIDRFDPRSNDFVRVIGALVIVIGLLLLLRTAMRRAGGLMAGGKRPSGVLEILAKYPIGRGQSLILLKVARRIVLLHQCGSGMTALSEMTDADEVAGLLSRMESGSQQGNATRFRNALAEFTSEVESSAKVRSGNSPRSLPLGDAELIDLTRKGGGRFAKLFGFKGGKA